jgi:hypothetical protein
VATPLPLRYLRIGMKHTIFCHAGKGSILAESWNEWYKKSYCLSQRRLQSINQIALRRIIIQSA